MELDRKKGLSQFILFFLDHDLFQARRALHALRGLVKLQALVRGHIVRKQLASTLMRMHSLMAIQVRARVQRIQLAEEAELVVRNQPTLHKGFSQDHRVSQHFCSSSFFIFLFFFQETKQEG